MVIFDTDNTLYVSMEAFSCKNEIYAYDTYTGKGNLYFINNIKNTNKSICICI